jgi:hypothetical protein
MRFQYDNFTLTNLDAWIGLVRPISIEMTDHQYSVLTGILRKLVKEYKGIPIHFVDAPKPT